MYPFNAALVIEEDLTSKTPLLLTWKCHNCKRNPNITSLAVPSHQFSFGSVKERHTPLLVCVEFQKLLTSLWCLSTRHQADLRRCCRWLGLCWWCTSLMDEEGGLNWGDFFFFFFKVHISIPMPQPSYLCSTSCHRWSRAGGLWRSCTGRGGTSLVSGYCSGSSKPGWPWMLPQRLTNGRLLLFVWGGVWNQNLAVNV